MDIVSGLVPNQLPLARINLSRLQYFYKGKQLIYNLSFSRLQFISQSIDNFESLYHQTAIVKLS